MRIAIVNAVAMAVEAVRKIILASGEHQIAWMGINGAEAVEFCARDTPDLILMDLIMPGTDGVQATRQIMACNPCAIVVVTANVTDNCSKVFEALGAGALDVVNAPFLDWRGSWIGASDLLAKVETIRKLIGAPPAAKSSASSSPSQAPPSMPDDCLIAIGASAGGPAAVARILSYLPAQFCSPMVVVQHVAAQFAQGLANWLDDHTPLRVRLAQEGDVPSPRTVLLPGRDRHLVFANHRHLKYTSEPADCAYRPSVDVFFDSVREHWPGDVIGVLLTGMGHDGAQGLRALRLDGHHTIAQDQASSAVYGMPKAAAQLDAATEILNLDQIGARLRRLATQEARMHA